MQIKAKRIDLLQQKVKKFQNNMVIKFLRSKGYQIDNTKIGLRRIHRQITQEGKKVIVNTKNEKLLRIGSYFVWDAYLEVKLINSFTGKEI